MYDIIKNVIESTRYELADMLQKIDTIWLQGNITDDQRIELVGLSRKNADPSNSYAPLQEQITALSKEVEDLVDRVTALEGGGTSPEEWPEYRKPIGAHDAYNNGDKITYNGKRYICKMDGCVWSPEEYPDAWKVVE